MSLDTFASYKKNPSIICTELDGGAVLLDLDSKFFFELNETGLRIWQLMEMGQDLREIAHKLVNEYEIDIEKATASVTRLMKDLEEENLIIPNSHVISH